MELSRELFNLIIAQLKGSGGGNNDKRKTPRVGLRNRVFLTPMKGPDKKASQSYGVIVRDLSPDGIGILHHRKIPADTLFAIRLPAPEAGDMLAIYRVEHCETLEEDLYRIGGSLVKLCDPNPDKPPVKAPKSEKPAADAAPAAPQPIPAEKDPKAPEPAAAS
jgi:hypothetical protein